MTVCGNAQIDDLEPAYTRYVDAYRIDYDIYEPVQSNLNLGGILAALPPISSDPEPGASPPTLDALFALPLTRLHYYKKLYAKLLKSTQPGKSDHNLLVGANEKLDWLLETGSQSAQRSVTAEPLPADEEAAMSALFAPAAAQTQPQSVKSPNASAHSSLAPSIAGTEGSSSAAAAAASANATSSQGRRTPVQAVSLSASTASTHTPQQQAHHQHGRPHSDTASASGSSSVERSSGQTTASSSSTATSAANTSETSSTAMLHQQQQQKKRMSPSQYLEDLERRLDTSRTLDIFSMKPKVCWNKRHAGAFALHAFLRDRPS